MGGYSLKSVDGHRSDSKKRPRQSGLRLTNEGLAHKSPIAPIIGGSAVNHCLDAVRCIVQRENPPGSERTNGSQPNCVYRLGSFRNRMTLAAILCGVPNLIQMGAILLSLIAIEVATSPRPEVLG